MSSLVGLDQMLALLERLRRVVQTVAHRADQLEREFSLNASRLDRQINSELKEAEIQLSNAILELDTAFQSHKQRIESSRDRRKTRIVRAHSAARKRQLKTIESHEGRQIFEVQRELIQTGRDRDSMLENAEQIFAASQDACAREREALTVLESRTRNAFRGYPTFRRLLDAADGSSSDSTAAVLPKNPSLPTTRQLPSQESGSPFERLASETPEDRASGRTAETAVPVPGGEERAPGEAGSAADESRMLEDLRALLAQTNRKLARFRLSPVPFLFSLLSPWLVILLLVVAHAAAPPLFRHLGLHALTWQPVGISLVACLAGAFALHTLGRLMAGSAAQSLASALASARALLDLCEKTAEARHHQETERIRHEADTRTEYLHQRWNHATHHAEEMRQTRIRGLDERLARASAKNERLCQLTLERVNQEHNRQVERLRNEADAQRCRLEKARLSKKQQIESNQHGHWQTLATEWNDTTRAVFDAFGAARHTADRLFPDWRDSLWENWSAPREFAAAAPFARLDVDVERLAGPLPRDNRLILPGPARFSLPLLLTCPDRGSILFETKDAGRDLAIGALNNLVLRLLSSSPPGRVVFTLLDPLDLGQSFAGFMHLTDHEERLINRRIWTQPDQIDQRLGELNEHIEKVTQLYLRNEYHTIAEYNDQAGRIAEPYHFLVIADFPVNFSDLAVRRLLSIVGSGPRCGVFTLVHWDQRKNTAADFVPDDLRKTSVCLRSQGGHFVLAAAPLEGTSLILEAPPGPELTTALLDKVGRSSVDFGRVEMPFVDIAPHDSSMWTLDTGAELRVPIGRTGATKFQFLSLGHGTRQHVLIAGKTGSGKSTLFHVLITNLALWCSPDQVEFYLVDFKKGVEFKCYAAGRLPHARVVAIESDREFGLSVLERLDEELRLRGELFRRYAVQDLAAYKRMAGAAPLPRTLLIIDEFQEFFVEDDRISQQASLLLDRLVRQGRAFGVHVLLGSQTLGGAYTLARTTLGQMVVRIALQCNEADAYLVMDDDNPAPRLLSRPGEAIYNDATGAIEGNSPFQVVWLSDEERAGWLEKIRRRSSQAATPHPGPVVFEGNAPADVRENAALSALLEGPSIQPPPAARAWLGAPNSIKGPTEVTFNRQSGNHLLIVGQRDDSALAMLGISLVSLATQYRLHAARFVLLDVSPPASPCREFLGKFVRAIPDLTVVDGNPGLPKIFADLAIEFQRRVDSQPASDFPPVYLFIHGIQRFKSLRCQDEFSISLDDTADSATPGRQLETMICEGPDLGFQVICTCDTLNNATRFFSRKTLSEFERRVLLQMSANDSASLLDTPKAAGLGPHRAILQNTRTGTLETFRPYALPDADWVEQAARHLAP